MMRSSTTPLMGHHSYSNTTNSNSNNMYRSRSSHNTGHNKRVESYIRWSFKAILLSPVVVLCLWTLTAMRVTSSTAAVVPKQPRKIAKKRRTTTKNWKQAGQEGILQVLEVAEHAYGSSNTIAQQPQHPVLVVAPLGQPQQQQQQILYYDPAQMVVDNNNQVQLPPVAYQADGTAVQLPDALRGSALPPQQQSAQGTIVQPILSQQQQQQNLFLQQAPAQPLQAPLQAAANLPLQKATHVVVPPPAATSEEDLPAAQLQIPTQVTTESSSPILMVSTVAVLALLLGALSARRLRGRSWLSACIENETLDDQDVYDGASSSYGAFEGEKFDV